MNNCLSNSTTIPPFKHFLPLLDLSKYISLPFVLFLHYCLIFKMYSPYLFSHFITTYLVCPQNDLDGTRPEKAIPTRPRLNQSRAEATQELSPLVDMERIFALFNTEKTRKRLSLKIIIEQSNFLKISNFKVRSHQGWTL